MNLISENPFRIIGVLANITDKDLHKQQSKLKKFSSIGKTLPSDYDYNFFNSIERTELSIANAVSKIEQREKKLEQSIFWFTSMNQFDEIAFKNLKSEGTLSAQHILIKITYNRPITEKNISSLLNLSTLQLMQDSFESKKVAIQNKISAMNSESFNYYVSKVVDSSFVVDKKQLIERFVDITVKDLKRTKTSELDIVTMFSTSPKWVCDYVASSLCDEAIHQIEILCKEQIEQRKAEPEIIYENAKLFFDNVAPKLKQVGLLLGNQNPRYSMLSDSVAKEMLQCDISHYNQWNKIKNVLKESLEIVQLAKKLAISEQLKSEVNKEIAEINSQIEAKRMSKYFEEVYNELGKYKDRPGSNFNARIMLINCRGNLNYINRMCSGSADYIELSSLVVIVVMDNVINEFNKAVRSNGNKNDIANTTSASKSVMESLQTLTMNIETKNRFNENYNTICKVNQVAQAKRNEGCYIATMAYGDYDHPQVLKLRAFRDDVLKPTCIGRLFIRVYYYASPKMVKVLNGQIKINKIVRHGLDKFINLLDLK